MHQPDSETGRNIEKRPKKAISKFSGFFFLLYAQKVIERATVYTDKSQKAQLLGTRALFFFDETLYLITF